MYFIVLVLFFFLKVDRIVRGFYYLFYTPIDGDMTVAPLKKKILVLKQPGNL
jgi:hypothetical protein